MTVSVLSVILYHASFRFARGRCKIIVFSTAKLQNMIAASLLSLILLFTFKHAVHDSSRG